MNVDMHVRLQTVYAGCLRSSSIVISHLFRDCMPQIDLNKVETPATSFPELAATHEDGKCKSTRYQATNEHTPRAGKDHVELVDSSNMAGDGGQKRHPAIAPCTTR